MTANCKAYDSNKNKRPHRHCYYFFLSAPHRNNNIVAASFKFGLISKNIINSIFLKALSCPFAALIGGSLTDSISSFARADLFNMPVTVFFFGALEAEYLTEQGFWLHHHLFLLIKYLL